MVRNQFILDVERRPVPGYEGLYEVDNMGNVFSVERRVQTRGRGNKLIRARNADDTARSGVLKGERNASHRLTETEVIELRSLREQGVTYAALASRFGISEGTVGRVIKRTHWRHVW